MKAINRFIRRRRSAGFTLLELVMVIVLLGIIAGASVPLMFEIVNGWQLSVTRNEMSESAKIGMDRMIREMRQISNRSGVITANSSVFQFIDVNGSDITFNLSGSNLMRTIGEVSNQLADNVAQLNFSYYDNEDSLIAVPRVNPQDTDIRRIVVDLVFSSAGTQLNIESGVSPRRLQ